MPRILPALLLAALVFTAGCTGVLDGPATETPTEARPEPAVATVAGPGSQSTGGAAVAPQPIDDAVVERPPSTGATDAAVSPDASSAVGAVMPAYGGYGGGATVGEAGTIAVAGTGQASAAPDRAVVYVTVQARAATADAARQQAAADAEALREAIREIGVPDDDVRTTRYAIHPRYDYAQERREEVVGYVAVHAYEITAPAERAGDVIDAAVAGGADQVGGVRFTLSDAAQRELRQQAVTDAVERARADADAIAAASDVTITGVHSASTSGPYVTPYVGRVAMAEDGATAIESGPVTVTAYVSIAYTVD